jgi:hypothetical protein
MKLVYKKITAELIEEGDEWHIKFVANGEICSVSSSQLRLAAQQSEQAIGSQRGHVVATCDCEVCAAMRRIKTGMQIVELLWKVAWLIMFFAWLITIILLVVRG